VENNVILHKQHPHYLLQTQQSIFTLRQVWKLQQKNLKYLLYKVSGSHKTWVYSWWCHCHTVTVACFHGCSWIYLTWLIQQNLFYSG